MVSHEKLMELLSSCPYCSCHSNVETHTVKGAYVKFRCVRSNNDCRHTHYWENTPKFKEKPIINLLLSAVILFSGSIPSKVLRAFSMLSLLSPSPKTFFLHQKTYLHGVSFPNVQLKDFFHRFPTFIVLILFALL